MIDHAGCRCCGGAFTYRFTAADWRSPEWPRREVRECGTCASLRVFSPVGGAADDAPDPLDPLAAWLAAPSEQRRTFQIPVADGYAWLAYRDNLVTLDPGRSAGLPSVEGVERLVAASGARLARRTRSCPAEHVVGSELIARRIHPLRADAEAVLGRGLVRCLHAQSRRAGRRSMGGLLEITVAAPPAGAVRW